MDSLKELIIESLVCYVIGITLVVLRLWAQGRNYGMTGYRIEDKAMVLASIFYTIHIVFNILTAAKYAAGSSSVSGLSDLAEQESSAYIAGSKYIMVAEQGIINTIYTLKFCMLVLYHRLTIGRRAQLAVKTVGAYVLLGWVANQIAYFTLTCQPFQGNWAVPPPNAQCVSWHHYSAVQGLFNISSDLAILVFPIPLFWRTTFPIKQKIYMCAMFSLAIFVVMCAILNKLNLNGSDWQFWNVREASCAIYVANIPVLASVVRRYISKTRKGRAAGMGTNLKNGSSSSPDLTSSAAPPATASCEATMAGCTASSSRVNEDRRTEKQFDEKYDPVVQDWREIRIEDDDIV